MSSKKELASVRMFSAPKATPRVTPPEADGTHFYTAGRIVSYFPQINRNGVTFFREDCKDLAKTLLASTADIQHVKPGYPVDDPLKVHLKNTIFSAISDVVEHEEGIDIVCKAEREVAKAMGFSEEDFGPGGKFGSYSQECDYKPLDSSFIIVDKDDPSKIIKEVAYADGLKLGMKVSHVGPDGEWNYYKVEGNPVYIRIKPMAFSGVGHVITPADESAEIYKLAASLESCRQLMAFFPGMDDTAVMPHDMVAEAGPTADMSPYAVDFLNHPDLRTASVDKFSDKDQEDDKAPDDHFAAVYSELDHGNVMNGKPAEVKRRMFRIKDQKGNLDRNRLIVAYHAMAGFRGPITKGREMPPAVRAHALELVRQGLKATKPKMNKETSSIVDINQEIEALKAREKELSDAKNAAETQYTELKGQVESLKADQTKVLASKDEEINSLKAKIAEFESKELSAKRLSQLEEILPFSEDEKKADAFGDYVKSLAALSEDGMQIAVLKRQLAKSEHDAKTSKQVSSAAGAAPAATVDPVAPFDVTKALASIQGEDKDKPTSAAYFLI